MPFLNLPPVGGKVGSVNTITSQSSWWEQRQALLKQWYKEAIKNKRMYPQDPQVYYKHKCWHCGRVFYAQSNRARFCGYRCTNDAHTKRQLAREKARREQIRRNRICEYCSTKFHAEHTANIVQTVIECLHVWRERKANNNCRQPDSPKSVVTIVTYTQGLIRMRQQIPVYQTCQLF
jgi:hypothetical protein